jgi:tetratricopeptide (TPR) repeat protein
MLNFQKSFFVISLGLLALPGLNAAARPAKTKTVAKPKASPATIASLLERATEEYKLENYASAADYYKRALEKDPTNPRIHFGIGACYIGQKQYSLAIEHLSRALELNPAILEAYFSLAYAYQASGKNNEALLAYRQGLGLDLNKSLPRSTLFNEVTLTATEEDDDQAESGLEGVSQGPTSLSIKETEKQKSTDLLAILTDPNYYTDQIFQYNEELEKHPNDQQIQYKLGMLYIKTKQYEQALSVQKKLEELDGDLAKNLKEKIEAAQTPKASTK